MPVIVVLREEEIQNLLVSETVTPLGAAMDYVMQGRIYDFVVATLRELGVANPRLGAINMRVLTKDGCYAGNVAQCEHIRVFFSESGQIIDFFGPGDVLLKKVGVEQIAA